MGNSVEKVRIDPSEIGCGGWVYFNWETGHMKAVWDNGYEENWPPRGYSIEAKAKSFFLFTDQIDRYLAMAA